MKIIYRSKSFYSSAMYRNAFVLDLLDVWAAASLSTKNVFYAIAYEIERCMFTRLIDTNESCLSIIRGIKV